MRRSTPVILLVLVMAAPLAWAGHVRGSVDPCSAVAPTGTAEVPGCPRGPPRDPCSARDAQTARECPQAAAAACVGEGLLVDQPEGSAWSSDIARSAASVAPGASAHADAATLALGAPPLADAGVLTSTCDADARACPLSIATAAADHVDLLGGTILVGHLEARAEAQLCQASSATTTFSDVVILGSPMDPLVHPGTTVVIPGVAIVTFGSQSIQATATGAQVVATALRVTLLDANGNDAGEILVGQAAARAG